MNFRIEKFDIGNLSLIKDLPPVDWNFDIINFIQKHFNQTYFHAFSINYKNQVIGFGNVFLFEKVSWLGNIIIDENYRNKGLGTKITSHLIDFSISKGANSLILIATDQGTPLYKKLGFEIDSDYKFFIKLNTKVTSNTLQLRKVKDNELSDIISMDFKITAENRSKLLKIYQNSIYAIADDQEIKGYYISDLGNGFIASTDRSTGVKLLKKLATNKSNIVIPERNELALKTVIDIGFEFHHKAPRMCFGRKINWKPGDIFSRGTGYCG